MASTSRYSNRDEGDEDRPRRRAPAKKGGPPLVPILALVVVIGGAIVAARFAAKNRKQPEAAPTVDASNIFGDLPEETPPVPGERGPGRARTTDLAPTGLASDPVWIEALNLADQAAGIFAEAKKAKAAGNHGEWNKLGNQAKDLYNEAVEKTALWEEELVEQYGDTDRQVRDIVRTRNKWLDVMRTLHKTTGRS